MRPCVILGAWIQSVVWRSGRALKQILRKGVTELKWLIKRQSPARNLGSSPDRQRRVEAMSGLYLSLVLVTRVCERIQAPTPSRNLQVATFKSQLLLEFRHDRSDPATD